MSIQELQNRPESLALLAAQHLLYTRAKRMRNIALALVFLVAVLGLLAAMSMGVGISHLLPTFALLSWLLDQQALKRAESAFRTEAATIQESFDCAVLDLPWPLYKGIDQPNDDRVQHLVRAARVKGELQSLDNWYPPDTIPPDPLLAKIHCQRLNCWWDVNLRRKWSALVTVFFCGCLGLLLVLSVMTGATVAKLIAILASNIRVVAWGLAERQNQAEAIVRVEGIHSFLSSFTAHHPPSPADIRSVQDAILDHRRANPPVPEWFYQRYRDDQEREASGD